jgi:hypothetical protein
MRVHDRGTIGITSQRIRMDSGHGDPRGWRAIIVNTSMEITSIVLPRGKYDAPRIPKSPMKRDQSVSIARAPVCSRLVSNDSFPGKPGHRFPARPPARTRPLLQAQPASSRDRKQYATAQLKPRLRQLSKRSGIWSKVPPEPITGPRHFDKTHNYISTTQIAPFSGNPHPFPNSRR